MCTALDGLFRSVQTAEVVFDIFELPHQESLQFFVFVDFERHRFLDFVGQSLQLQIAD